MKAPLPRLVWGIINFCLAVYVVIFSDAPTWAKALAGMIILSFYELMYRADRD